MKAQEQRSITYEEWLPTRKTNGRDVPRSEFLARGPPRLAFIGIMDEWRCEHFDNMACCAELDGTPPPSACAAPAVSSLDGVGVGAGVTFFDQFQVDRGRSRRHELLPKAGPSLVANAATGPLGRRHRIAIAALILCGARLRAVTGSDVPPRPNVYEASVAMDEVDGNDEGDGARCDRVRPSWAGGRLRLRVARLLM